MNNLSKEQQVHKKIIESFIIDLNKETDNFILKGGTSLMLCYNLDRFSEDIDLDYLPSDNILSIKSFVEKFCHQNRFKYNISKDTPTVKRFKIHYDGDKDDKYLKVEISYRRKNIPTNEINNVNGISVYTIDKLGEFKAMAYAGRDKIRDFYDICFICNNYFDNLSQSTKSVMQTAILEKGLNQYDYLVSTQKDELINNEKLLNDFLLTCNKLNILLDDGSKIKPEVAKEELEEDLEIGE